MNLLVGLIACRISDRAPDRVRCADLFDAATLGGAQALGRDDLGRLAPGARADIAVFGLDDAVMAPSIDPITTLVAGGSGIVPVMSMLRTHQSVGAEADMRLLYTTRGPDAVISRDELDVSGVDR